MMLLLKILAFIALWLAGLCCWLASRQMWQDRPWRPRTSKRRKDT